MLASGSERQGEEKAPPTPPPARPATLSPAFGGGTITGKDLTKADCKRMAHWKDGKKMLFEMGRALAAEFIGTFILVLLSCGTATVGGTLVEIALAFAFTVASVVVATAHVSGGHVNPAVTAGFLAAGRIHPIRAGAYVVAQTLGGLAGAGTLYGILPPVYRKAGLGAVGLHSGITPLQTTAVELIISFTLVLVVFGVCDSNRLDFTGSGPLAIGVAIGACHLFAVKLTGSGMNPARSLGPAAVTENWDHHWAYWVGPLIGGVLAGLLYKFLFSAPTPSYDDVQLVKLKELKRLSQKDSGEDGMTQI